MPLQMSPSPQNAPRKAGRPVDAAKTAHILSAAKSLFFANGFEAVTIEQIASQAKVAKTTIYSKFGSKEAVFRGVLGEIAEMAEQDMQIEISDGQGARQVLDAFGLSLLTSLTQPALIVAEPMILMSTRRDPELGQKFYENGPGRAEEFLTTWIKKQQRNGDLQSNEAAEDMAETLLGLWLGLLHHKLRLSTEPYPSHDDLQQRVERGTRKFLDLYQVTARQ